MLRGLGPSATPHSAQVCEEAGNRSTLAGARPYRAASYANADTSEAEYRPAASSATVTVEGVEGGDGFPSSMSFQRASAVKRTDWRCSCGT